MGRVLYEVPEGYVRQPGDVDGSWDLLSEEDQADLAHLDPRKQGDKVKDDEKKLKEPSKADDIPD